MTDEDPCDDWSKHQIPKPKPKEKDLDTLT
jgi:hypothetical protein